MVEVKADALEQSFETMMKHWFTGANAWIERSFAKRFDSLH